MKSSKVELFKPEKLKIVDYEIEDSNKNIIVKPKYLSVCNADIRYFMGDRPPEVLKKKLPLVLIHECSATVVESNDDNYKVGDNVCIVPLSRHQSPLTNEYNYDYPLSRFMSSSADGCMQSLINLKPENLVKISNIELRYASVVEVASIAAQALSRLNEFYKRDIKKIAIHGTGSVAFWTALFLKATRPNAHITVIGRSQKKLDAFDFIDERILQEDLVLEAKYDLVVEAVGGYGSESVLTKAIAQVKPVGCILMLGVSESNLSLNTRQWMEKGILLLTSHRSTQSDFQFAVDLIESNKLVQDNLPKSVSRIVDVKSLDDIYTAISEARIYQFKTVMDWKLFE